MNRRAFALGAVMVLLCSAVAVALRSYAEATFLIRHGAAALPWLLVANATGFAVATLGYDRIASRATGVALDVGMLLLLAAAAVSAPWLLDRGVPPIALVVGLSATSQLAGLALWNRVAAAVAGRDARRMLPRAGAAVTLGGAIAGLGASALIPRIGVSAIPQLGAVIAVAAGVAVIAQARALARGGAPGAAAPVTRDQVATPLAALPERVVRALVAAAIAEAVVSTALDLQFVSALRHGYGGDELPRMVALFYGGTNAALFALQATTVPGLLLSRSLAFTAAIHPALVIAFYAVFAIAPGFGTIATARTVDQTLRLATSRTSQELALSALPPGPRARWKLLLRGAIWPAGSALAALVLLAIGPRALAVPRTFAVAAIAIALPWLAIARAAAHRFAAALQAPLGMRDVRGSAPDPLRIDLATLSAWTARTGDRDPRRAAIAKAALARARIDATDIADHLRDDQPSVRAALYAQLAAHPMPSLRGELRAAIAFEDDDDALVAAIEAATLAGDDAGLVRGEARAGLSDAVDRAVGAARATLRGGGGEPELWHLLAGNPRWACALVDAHRGAITDAALDDLLGRALADPVRRGGALALALRRGSTARRAIWVAALRAGDPDAHLALGELDDAAATTLAGEYRALSVEDRLAIARALADTTGAGPLWPLAIGDGDLEVCAAGGRAALAYVRAGRALPVELIASARDAAHRRLRTYLDARDAYDGGDRDGVRELDIALRRAVAHALATVALDAVRLARDPAPLAAAARHLVSEREANRRRALDVAQELDAGPVTIALLERWLSPSKSRADVVATELLAPIDGWLAGELAMSGSNAEISDPRWRALRSATAFAAVSGPALAALLPDVALLTIDRALASDERCAAAVVARGRVRAGGDAQLHGDGALFATPFALQVVEAPCEVAAISADGLARAVRRTPELALALTAASISSGSGRQDVLTPAPDGQNSK